ncbi:MAG: DUF6703 family protein [Candidatus Nanopelagicales bacterium]
MPQSKRHPARRPQQRPARPSHRNPAKAAASAEPPRPTSTGWRRSLEKVSVGPLVVMNSLPGWVVPVLLAVLLVAGLALPFTWSGLLLLIPTAFLGWLLLLSWPVIKPGGRLLRLIAVLVLLGAAVFRLTGRF